MKRLFMILLELCLALAFLAACNSDAERKLANGYTEEQNAQDPDYEAIVKTFESLLPLDSTMHVWENENGDTVTWYEINLTSTGEVYYSREDSTAGSIYVNVFVDENAVRMNVQQSSNTSQYTETLERDSSLAVSISRLDNEYVAEGLDSVCRADSLSFVNSCETDGGTVVDMVASSACEVLHLVCKRTFRPELVAREYLLKMAEKLVAQGEERLKSTTDDEDSTLVDARDGQVYKIVKIGTQTWMAENLKLAYLQPTSLWDSSSFCYQNDPANCETYGRLYTWSAALDSAGLYSDDAKDCGSGLVCLPGRSVRGVCPEGWRIPNYDEWNTLIHYVGEVGTAGGILKSTEDGGTDDYGFGLRLAGRHIEFDQSENSYSNLGGETMYHTTAEKDSSSALAFAFNSLGNYVGEGVFYSKYIAYPVRCIKGEATAYPEGAVDPSTVTEGSFTDARDSQVYKTVSIGNLTWMASNLNYNSETSLCYDDDESNCTAYGRLYTWSDASEICPSGWRLPSMDEMDSLHAAVGISYAPLKSSSGWSTRLGNGTDAYGFNLLPNGMGTSTDGSVTYSNVGISAYLWTSTEGTSDSTAYIFDVEMNASGNAHSLKNESSYLGVRCVME